MTRFIKPMKPKVFENNENFIGLREEELARLLEEGGDEN